MDILITHLLTQNPMTKCSLLHFLMESSRGVIYKWLYCAECPHGPFKCYLIMKFHLLFAGAFMHLSWGHANSRAISRLPFYRSSLIWKALHTFSPLFSINHSFSGANCKLWKTCERQNVTVFSVVPCDNQVLTQHRAGCSLEALMFTKWNLEGSKERDVF